MDIDLVTERNIQLFIRLSGLPPCQVSTLMYWRGSRLDTYLNINAGRLHLSQFIPDVALDDQTLRRGLHWHPAQFAGIVQRFYRLKQVLVMSCSPPIQSNAELWLLLYRRQRAFLEALCRPA